MTASGVLRFMILVIACAGVAGCQRSGRVTSTGTVTYGGQPVETGVIVFHPLDRGSAPEAAPISAGRFTIRGGLGKRRVEIRGTRQIDESTLPKTMPRLEGVPLYEDYIPSAYNTASTLEADVTADGRNVFDFDLPTAPAER